MGKLDGKLSFEDVRRIFNYDQRTGELRWKIRMGCRALPGSRAGTQKPRGHWEVKVHRVRYQAHRIIWLWMTGVWPKEMIDHKDCDPSNNRWSNLREATAQENIRNRPVMRTNEVGLKGVSPQFRNKDPKTGVRPRTGRWKAQIRINSRVVHLGFFKTPEEAHAAYKRAADQFYGAFARA